MEKIIKVNENMMFSNEHMVLTKRGLIKAKKLKIGNKVIGLYGEEITITNIIKCGKRPDAPIIGNTK